MSNRQRSPGIEPEPGNTRRFLLNFGCGDAIRPGWVNVDRIARTGVDLVCDIRDGLPLAADSVDAIAGIHVLQDVAYLEVLPALSELRRVLKPAGILRLGLPDLDRAVAAYARRDAQYFYVRDDEAASLGGKLITQIIWYGSVRTPFTYDFIEELLLKAVFTEIHRCEYRQTASGDAALVELDNRPRESLFVEARKPCGDPSASKAKAAAS